MTEGADEDPARDPAGAPQPDEGADEGGDGEQRRRRRARREERRRKLRRRRRRRRAAIITGVTSGTLLILGVVWFWWTFGALERMPDSVAAAGANTPGTTILLVGSDPGASAATRSEKTGWREDLERSDLVMLLHLTSDNRALYVISIPRDSTLNIPGIGPGKLSDAAKAGGAPLVARTVEETTGVRLDRMAVMNLNAFREIVDVLDGVVVDVPRDVCGMPAGPRRLDGQEALDYIALQPCMPDKDLDRVERQQSLVKALMRGAVDSGAVIRPLAMNNMLRATASHLALEKDFSYPSMLGTLWSMRHLRTGNTTFMTVPVAAQPLVSQDGTDYVRLDERSDAVLWAALRDDQLAAYLQLHADAQVLGR